MMKESRQRVCCDAVSRGIFGQGFQPGSNGLARAGLEFGVGIDIAQRIDVYADRRPVSNGGAEYGSAPTGEGVNNSIARLGVFGDCPVGERSGEHSVVRPDAGPAGTRQCHIVACLWQSSYSRKHLVQDFRAGFEGYGGMSVCPDQRGKAVLVEVSG